MNSAPDSPAPRAVRPALTRSWIVAAFNRLVLRRPYEAMGVAEVSRRAGVGRSTFYEHFRDKDDLLRHALGPVLGPLADAAVGEGDVQRVQAVADHFAENRPRTLAMLEGPTRVQVERALIEMILVRLGDTRDDIDAATRRLFAAQVAGGHVALLRAWLEGGAGACPSARVAAILTQTPERVPHPARSACVGATVKR